uniref:Uncharacterized protein n=1 Tax=Arundo donax TaxID=35708 RepID=A0A0A9HLB6_ARUDO
MLLFPGHLELVILAVFFVCRYKGKPKPKPKPKPKIGMLRQITAIGVHAQHHHYQQLLKRSHGTISVKLKNPTLQVVGSKSKLTGMIS